MVGRRRPTLRLLAMRDIEAVDDDEPNTLTKDSGEMYDIVGPVSAVEGSSVTFALEDRAVEVRLNGHDNHVEVGSRGRAWGMLVG
ncbi:MAG: hypothetical protein ABIO16_17950, partial [Nocardioides sp.]